MAQVIMNGPPDGPGRGWCPVCLMTAKQRQWEMFQEAIQDGYKASGDKPPVIIPWPDALTRELFEGTYRAVSGEAPMLGIVDGLCWNHVAGINPTETEPVPQLDTSTKLPPGLLKKGR
jgi:hypothetical protein